MPPPAPIPDILLSQAKDDRYISDISSLLSQIASVCIFPLCRDRRNSRSGSGAPSATVTTSTTQNYYGRGDNDDDDDHEQHHFINRLLPELNLLASIIVHSSAFIYYSNAINDESQSTLGMESLNLKHRMPATNKRMETPYPSKLSSMIQIFRNAFMGTVPSSFRNVNHFQQMVIVQTIVPYILQRVSRGGWIDDLRGLIPARSEIIDNVGGAERTRNDERLRGSARRRLFDEQRRQMLQSTSTPPSNANGHHGGNEAENESANLSNNATLNSVDTDQSTAVISPTRNANGRRLPDKIAALSWNALRVSDENTFWKFSS